jgi:hypothetical protein
MFWILLCALVLIVLPVACALIPEGHDNGYTHSSGEDKDSAGDDEGVALAARRAA